MNIVLLRPTDVLFFRDGRPMNGSLAGHTAAWPLPDVTNHALHAALHRAELDNVHQHRRGHSGTYQEERDRKFGSLKTIGPFPVDDHDRWYFPRPADFNPPSLESGSVRVPFRPAFSSWHNSSLPEPLKYAVASTIPAAKEAGVGRWLSAEAYALYLRGGNGSHMRENKPPHFLTDKDLADQEATIGIGIDPETQVAGQGDAAGKIYSAHYLRLREGFRLGLGAVAEDKDYTHPQHGRDLVRALLHGNPAQILVGGQQRLCTASCEQPPAGGLPLPLGLRTPGEFRVLANGKAALKWVLLSPAVFPEIPDTKKSGEPQNPHPGGWLPNWVDAKTGAVLLTAGAGVRKAARKKTSAGGGLAARLVAALIPKPLVVTGWALPSGLDRPEGGAKSTHLAVPAGAVYYFEADAAEDAAALAAALNWHGSTAGAEIKNRRSTLLGEKGYGLGVCGTWDFFANVSGRPGEAHPTKNET
jgi:hypothetical protein